MLKSTQHPQSAMLPLDTNQVSFSSTSFFATGSLMAGPEYCGFSETPENTQPLVIKDKPLSRKIGKSPRVKGLFELKSLFSRAINKK